ncbi:glyoxalase [Acaricomes phytoseiuli]|uniref:glyoxalase n=1 Tax=Acaricomes phytoseiuli TaxID=291968 RepID=UPI002222BB64|nr:glyoxalase [Acaricomes phytoseiuli]MCW1249108.1 glyoxalase [Acaricomes phytoseiuli]
MENDTRPLVEQNCLTCNETLIPVLPCHDAAETAGFYSALGFNTVWDQRKPYLYLAYALGRIELHFGAPPAGFDPEREDTGGALIMVDSITPYHRAFAAGLKQHLGKVPQQGRPRLTRLRDGAKRFTLVDPSGNNLIVIQRDEPAKLDYGGSPELAGLSRVLDNARILRDYKQDELQAIRALKSGLKRHGAAASSGERQEAYRMLVELSVDLNLTVNAEHWRNELAAEPVEN